MQSINEVAFEKQVASHPDGRWAEVEFLAAYREAQKANGVSLLQFAQERGIPETTIRHWVRRAEAADIPPAWAELIESPAGLWILHRIVVAAILVLTQVVGGGVRTVCLFLNLSGLWRVVAAGYGTQQAAVKAMEEAIVAFGTNEGNRLGSMMAPRKITIAPDETFHEQICLVAIEPVSNFILVEENSEDRRAKTWSAAMLKGLKDLPVKVIQLTSDEGSALISMAKELEANHSPDLFHPQQDISRATSLALQRQADAAEQAAADAAQLVEGLMDEAEAYAEQGGGPGRPRDYDKRLSEAFQKFEETESAAKEAQAKRQQVREAARGISKSYHPFDLETGAVRDSAMVESELNARFNTIEQIATRVGLSAKCMTLLDKARRLVPKMVATIAFVHNMIRTKIEALDLAPAVESFVVNNLIPVFYLEEIVHKAPSAEAREKLRNTITRLRDVLNLPGSILANLDDNERNFVMLVARECAQLFQRSSSNVEGRNGVLALMHHSLHLLSPRKLNSLTVVHNYFIRRSDSTTAAERFFGQQHRDLFEHLLAVLPPPKRPAARRRTVY